jgi:hypothetical protein
MINLHAVTRGVLMTLWHSANTYPPSAHAAHMEHSSRREDSWVAQPLNAC